MRYQSITQNAFLAALVLTSQTALGDAKASVLTSFDRAATRFESLALSQGRSKIQQFRSEMSSSTKIADHLNDQAWSFLKPMEGSDSASAIRQLTVDSKTGKVTEWKFLAPENEQKATQTYFGAAERKSVLNDKTSETVYLTNVYPAPGGSREIETEMVAKTVSDGVGRDQVLKFQKRYKTTNELQNSDWDLRLVDVGGRKIKVTVGDKDPKKWAGTKDVSALFELPPGKGEIIDFKVDPDGKKMTVRTSDQVESRYLIDRSSDGKLSFRPDSPATRTLPKNEFAQYLASKTEHMGRSVFSKERANVRNLEVLEPAAAQ